MIKIEKKSPKTNDEEFLDLDIINNNLSEFINEATFLQDYSIDMYRDFVEIERYIKTNNKEAKNSVNDIKKFFERVSKDSFYLGGILKDTFSTINKLAIDEVSCLKIRKLLYHYIARLMLLKEKTKEKTNPTINDVEIFRFGGDEFIAVISRGYGIEVAFFDLMYLNYFNELMGYRGGDSAIFNICNTIEKTFKSYIGKTTKTKDIIDKILLTFEDFIFPEEYKILNNIILHVDFGYSNDIEVGKLEEDFNSLIKNKKIKEEKGLFLQEKVQALIDMAEIRASFTKKISKFYLLANLYGLSYNNDDIKNMLNGYLSFTKKMPIIKELVEKIVDNSKNSKEILVNIISEAETMENSRYKEILKTKTTKREKAIYELIFSQAMQNISKAIPNISIEKAIKRWGID